MTDLLAIITISMAILALFGAVVIAVMVLPARLSRTTTLPVAQWQLDADAYAATLPVPRIWEPSPYDPADDDDIDDFLLRNMPPSHQQLRLETFERTALAIYANQLDQQEQRRFRIVGEVESQPEPPAPLPQLPAPPAGKYDRFALLEVKP